MNGRTFSQNPRKRGKSHHHLIIIIVIIIIIIIIITSVATKARLFGARSLRFASYGSRWPPSGVLMLETTFRVVTVLTCSHAFSVRLNIISS